MGEAADIARALVTIPIVKIDERMAEMACRTGSRIGVVATAASTMGPTTRLLSRTAERMGKRVTLVEELHTDAFERMITGDKKGHNELLLETIRACIRGSTWSSVPRAV